MTKRKVTQPGKPLIRATYDPMANAGYIYLDGDIPAGGAPRQHMVYLKDHDEDSVTPDIVLDFSPDGRLIGIELLRPKEHMPKGLAAEAELLE